MARRLLILGAGGHGRAVADLAAACGFTLAGFTDRTAGGRDVVGTDDELPALAARLGVDAALVGVGSTAIGRRAGIFERLGAARLDAPALLHPRATASPSGRVWGRAASSFPAAWWGSAWRSATTWSSTAAPSSSTSAASGITPSSPRA